MATNENTKAARSARVRYAEPKSNDRRASVAPSPPARYSARQTKSTISEDFDGSHYEGLEPRASTQVIKNPGPGSADDENLRVIRDALQAEELAQD